MDQKRYSSFVFTVLNCCLPPKLPKEDKSCELYHNITSSDMMISEFCVEILGLLIEHC
jgi:hypothetical protein